MRAIVVVALLALFACTFTVAQETAVADAPRFAETEHEDAATLAEQEADWSAMVAGDTEEADEADEVEAEEEADEEVEADEEADEEVDEADEAEADEEVEEEADEEAEEADEAEAEEEVEDETEADEEDQNESEDEVEEESENTDFVLAELKDNAVMTGFMEMMAKFVPTAARAADHMVHSLSSHQQAQADQQYAYGYAHGHADASSVKETDEEEGEEAEEEADEASFVEGGAKAESEHHPVYTAQYYAGYPHVAGVYYQQHYPIPAPPQLPTWLPPPPYITPVETKDKEGGGDE
jgi:hypothetical protein